MIQLQDIFLNLDGKSVLTNISFSLLDDENLIVLGKSGSGKTVLIKTLMGLYTPVQGTVLIDDVDIHRSRESDVFAVRQKIAMVFQNAALLDSYTVFQNVALPLYERGEKDFAWIRNRVDYCLELVGLSDTREMFPAELSGGMRKRIGIARALVYEPQWIIFDEPVSGLDPMTSREILFYMAKIIREKQITSITITHDLRDLEAIGNRVLFLKDGQCLFFGGIDELYKSNDLSIREFLNR